MTITGPIGADIGPQGTKLGHKSNVGPRDYYGENGALLRDQYGLVGANARPVDNQYGACRGYYGACMHQYVVCRDQYVVYMDQCGSCRWPKQDL